MIRRIRPWLALVAALVFVAAGAVTAEHHHDEPGAADRGADCSTCTLAHAPAIASTTTALPAPLRLTSGLAPDAAPATPARTPARRAAPRAPPTH